MSDDRDFLNKEIFPNLDAAASGLLEELNPKTLTNRYQVDCPVCKKKQRAYYTAGGSIVCNRIESCREGAKGITIWSYLRSSKGLENKDIFKVLCDAVGKYPDKTTVRSTPDIKSIFKRVTRTAMQVDIPAVKAFMNIKKLDSTEISRSDYGYYPSSDAVRQLILNEKGNPTEAEALNYISKSDRTKDQNNCFLMADRIIGYWPQTDGKLCYWGYSPTEKPKYLFSKGLLKTKPYKFYVSQEVNIVEGTMDCDTMILCGIKCMAIGQAGLNQKQAEYLSSKGIKHVNHIIDTGIAGIIGGLDTINTCYTNNLACSIVFLGNECDDPDNLRKIGRLDILEDSMKNSITGHRFAAMCHAKSLRERPSFDVSYRIQRNLDKWPAEYQKLYHEDNCLLGFTTTKIQQELAQISALDPADTSLKDRLKLLLASLEEPKH